MYFTAFETEMDEAMKYIQIKLRINNDPDNSDSDLPHVLVEMGTSDAFLYGMWIGEKVSINAILRYLSSTGQQIQSKSQRQQHYSELEECIISFLRRMKKRLYLRREDNADDQDAPLPLGR